MLREERKFGTIVGQVDTQGISTRTSAAESGSLQSMNKKRYAKTNLLRLFLPAAWLLCLGSILVAQAPTAPATPSGMTTLTRPCTANPVLASPKSKKGGSHKPKQALPPEPAPLCIEAKGEPLEIQEFLQGMVREQLWRIGENHASEDMWSFIRYLNADELERFADTKVLIEPVDFTSGKAAVIIRTTDLGAGFSRVQISAKILGEGRSTEKAMAQPGSEWPLNSKGVLEQELVTALRTSYKPLE